MSLNKLLSARSYPNFSLKDVASLQKNVKINSVRKHYEHIEMPSFQRIWESKTKIENVNE